MRDFKNRDSNVRSNRWLRNTVGAGLAALAVCSAASGANAGGIDPRHLSGTANLSFDDEFTYLNLWDGKSGTWDTDFWYDPLHGNGNTLENNGEQEWYINSNYSKTDSVVPWHVKNGILTLTGNPAPKDIQPLINNYKYTSGEINSHNSFSQKYGYFAIRCKLPHGQGTWPAFWLLAENGSWPPEIDILEVLGQQPTVLYTSAHIEKNGQEVDYGKAVKVPDTSKAFHVYGVDWEPDYMTWYFDNKPVYKLKTPSSMNVPMFIETNLALGGNWGGDVDGTTPFPSNMQVDWIRVYTAKP